MPASTGTINSHPQDSSNRLPDPLQTQVYDSSSQLNPSDSAQILYLLVEVRPGMETNSTDAALPLNVSFVIDRSTSMRGERLNKVKAATNLVIDKLTLADTISIISYSDRASVVVPATKPNNKKELFNRVRGIEASGGTEIYQGLFAAIKEIYKHPIEQYINHVILLTDGHTYGDADLCLQLAQKAAAKGIGISGFGIGSEWNDQFLDSIVAPSGNQSGYIAEPEQIIHYLRQRIQGLGAIYAQNVRLKLQLPQGVTIKDAFKLTPFAQPVDLQNSTELQLGSIEQRQPLTVLLEIVVPPTQSGRMMSVPIDILAEIPSLTNPHVVLKNTHNIIIDKQPSGQKMHEILVKAVQILNFSRMTELAWQSAEAGDIAAATKKMEMLSMRFREAGFTQLAQQAQAQTRQLGTNETMSYTGKMQLKYGTRAQLTQALSSALNR